ncbi:MAG: biotin/lipoyl-binding protein [Ardenticatenaceae bacterium]|nr:biotin/lipoyl-binding protein [Ardenticatenaceae bacterium]
MSRLAVTLGDRTFYIELNWTPQQGGNVVVEVDGEPVEVMVPGKDPDLEEITWLLTDNQPLELVVDPDLAWLWHHDQMFPLHVRDLDAQVARPPSGDTRVKAPIPGLVARILVEPGHQVEVGDSVLVLEAMKMENEVSATATGVIDKIHVTPGQTVMRNDVLIEIS